MSLLRKDDAYVDRNEAVDKVKLGTAHGEPDLGVVIALVCAALAITLVTALFAPAPVASQPGSEVVFVGP